jgi:hypothetical protein
VKPAKSAINTRSTAILSVLLLLLISSAMSQSRGEELRDSPGFSVDVSADEGRAAVGGNAVVDLGDLSLSSPKVSRRGQGRTSSYVITRHFRLRVARSDRQNGRVEVSAYLLQDCFNCKLRIDGVEISTIPKVVAADTQLNTSISHRLEIEVPNEAAAGALNAEIGWEVRWK